VIVAFVVQDGDAFRLGKQALEQAKPFAHQIGRNTRKASRISTGTPQAAQEFFDRIASDYDDRNILALLFCREQHRFPRGEKYVDLQTRKLAGKNRKPVIDAVSKTRFDNQVSSFLVSESRKASRKAPSLCCIVLAGGNARIPTRKTFPGCWASEEHGQKTMTIARTKKCARRFIVMSCLPE
jgi:hypothetical protein